VTSPDPTRALITGNPLDANFFRIPTLWGSAKTGPWFHDNSAKTLPDLAKHYSDYFEIVLGVGLTPQQQADIIAYLKLLD
jgi:cytochrome c peroxidase